MIADDRTIKYSGLDALIGNRTFQDNIIPAKIRELYGESELKNSESRLGLECYGGPIGPLPSVHGKAKETTPELLRSTI